MSFSPKKYRKKVIGYYFGLAAVFFTFYMVLLAFMVSKKYNIYLQTISKLGIDPIGKYFFISGTVIGGILLIIFQLLFFSDDVSKSKSISRGRFFGILAGVGIIGVGMFPDYPDDLFFKGTHFIFSVIFFLFTTISILFFGFFLKENGFEKYVDKLLYKFSLLVLVLAILHTFFSFFKGTLVIGNFEFGLSVVWQKITVSFLLTWYILALKTNNSLIPRFSEE